MSKIILVSFHLKPQLYLGILSPDVIQMFGREDLIRLSSNVWFAYLVFVNAYERVF